MKTFLKSIAKTVLNFFEPLVIKIAGYYGFSSNKQKKLQYMGTRPKPHGYMAKTPWVHGQNPLYIESGNLNGIPASVYFNTRSGSICVGQDTVFGESVMLLTGKHINIEEAQQTNRKLHSVPTEGRDIRIGKGCYIGSGAIIIGPAAIGNYSVVGAGSVVTKNVDELTFVAGNPAKVVRKICKK